MKKKSKNHQKQVIPEINQNKCEVCFIPTDKAQFHNQRMDLITCKKCKKNTHRICYNSNIQSNQFECDLCKETTNTSKNAKECMFCHNTGLLKKISGAKAAYAHPICLLINPDVQIKSFFTLEFQLIPRDTSKQLAQIPKCALCLKQCSYGYKCWETKCQLRVHLYCLLREYPKWIFNLKINHGFAGFTQNLIFKCLSIFDNSKSLKSLIPDYKSMQDPGILYCIQHTGLDQGCICQEAPQQQKITWIQCDRCKQWYHATCIKNNETSLQNGQNQQKSFICQYCYGWEEAQKSQNLQMAIYPKLQLYDHIFIHQIYESNKKVPSVLMDNELICYKIEKSKGTAYYVKELLEKNLRYLVKIWQVKQLLSFSLSSFKIIQKIEYLVAENKLEEKQKEKGTKKNKKKESLPDEMIKSLKNLCLVSKQYADRFQIYLDNIQKYKHTEKAVVPRSQIHFLQSELYLFKQKLQNNSLEVLNIYQDLIKKIIKVKALNIKFSHKLPKLFQFINYPDQSNKYIKLSQLLYNLYWILNSNNSQKISRRQFYTMTQNYQSLKKQFGTILNQLYYKVQNSNNITSYNQQIANSIQLVQNYLNKKGKITFNEFKAIKERQIQLKISDSPTYIDLNQSFVMLASEIDFIQSKFGKFSSQTKSIIQKFLSQLNSYKIELDDSIKKIFESYITLCDIIQQIYDQVKSLMQQDMQIEEQQSFEDMIDYISYAYGRLKQKSIKITNLIYKKLKSLVQKQVRTGHKKFQQVMTLIFTDYLRYLEDLKDIKPQKLKTIIKIMEICGMNGYFYIECLQKYQTWYNDYIVQIQGFRIDKILEDPKQCKKVLEILKSALQNALDIEIDISNYVNKIRLLEIQVRITLKSYDQFIKSKQKIKILALKQVIKIMKEIRYPKNKIYQKLIQLDQKASELVKKVELFSVKKVKKQYDIFEQLNVIDKKLTISDATKLETELKNSQFDFDYKIDDIYQEIKKFQEKEKLVESLIKKPNLEEIQKLYRYFLDTPLKCNKFIELRDILRKLKCSTIPKSRKQLQSLLIWGSIYTLPLIQKTKQTRLAYKKLDSLQESAKKSRYNEYIELEKLRQLSRHLLEEDYRQKLLITDWENIYLNTKGKLQYMMNCLIYNSMQAENLMKIMKSVPIRSDKLEMEFIQKKQIYEEFKYGVEKLSLQIMQDTRLQQNRILAIEKLIIIKDTHNFYMKQFQFLRSQLNHYKFLKNSHFQKNYYLNFLKQCNLLKSSFVTQQIIYLRKKLFFTYKEVLQEDITYEFIKYLEKEIQFLIQHTNDHSQKKQLIDHLLQCINKRNNHEQKIQASLNERKIKSDQNNKIQINQQQQQQQQSDGQQQDDQQMDSQDDGQNSQQEQDQDEQQVEEDQSNEIQIKQASNNQFESKKRKIQRVTGHEPQLINLRIKENVHKKPKPNDIVILEDSQ